MLIQIKLLIARDSLKPGYDFLRIFQSGSVKIHLVHDSMKLLLRETLLEIVEPVALKNSKGERLDGKDLKQLELETKEERQRRHLEEKEPPKNRLSRKKEPKFQRRAQL